MTYIYDEHHANRCRKLAHLVFAFSCCLPAPSGAQVTATLVASGYDEPVAVVPDPAYPVFYVVERKGLIRVVSGGVAQPDPFIDLRDSVSTSAEGGLLGM